MKSEDTQNFPAATARAESGTLVVSWGAGSALLVWFRPLG
mgnify:CR=1 FL=1